MLPLLQPFRLAVESFDPEINSTYLNLVSLEVLSSRGEHINNPPIYLGEKIIATFKILVK